MRISFASDPRTLINLFKISLKEGRENEIYLAEFDPKVFEQYVDWVYSASPQVAVPTVGRSNAPSTAEFD